jgi:tryptophanase
MRQNFPGFPILAGGHALYIAADQVLPNVKIINCPAEYLNALMMQAIRTRGCAIGSLVYGGRIDLACGKVQFRNELPIDALRLAIPRNQYTDDELISQLSVIGQAYTRRVFTSAKGGLSPIDYTDNGFYHFGAEYNLLDSIEFFILVNLIKK